MKCGTSETSDEGPAPALARGLAILQLLAVEDLLSLDQITQRLKLPKASVHRLLDTLEKADMVHKGPDKRYAALWHLHPANSALATFRAGLDAKMQRLMKATGRTIEWYEPAAAGMQLVLQKNPETELCVKARPGYLRDWATELEAVVRLGQAFSSLAPSPAKSRVYTANGVLTELTKKDIQQQIRAARASRTAHDSSFNTNGVRRFAAAAFAPGDQHFLGVLAMAEVYHFSRLAEPKAMLELLQSTLK